MLNLNLYKSPSNETSMYKGIPIALLEETKKILRENGVRYHVKYRGPRNYSVGDTRDKQNKQASCLRRFATSFAVYPPTYE